MLPRKSKFSAPVAERPVLASYWITALLAALVSGALWLMYPRQDLERRLVSSSRDSSLSLAYLKNLLRSDPNNVQLQQLMAQRVAVEEERKKREEALANRKPTAWTRWSDAMDGFHAIPEADAEARNERRTELVAQLHELTADEVPPDVLPALAENAFQLGGRLLGIQLYRRLGDAADSAEKAVPLYVRAAREALAVSAHPQAASLYMKARHATTNPEQAKALYLSAVAAMQASGKPAEALALAQQEVAGLDSDPVVLRTLVELARAAGKPAVAEQYVKRLLQLALLLQWQQSGAVQASATAEAHPLAPALLPVTETEALTPGLQGIPQPRYEDRAYLLDARLLSHPADTGMQRWATAQGQGQAAGKAGPGLPFDNQIYTLGYQVFLENRNLEDAWLVARSAVQQSPSDLQWRERLAQVAEWTQRSDVALENWLVIARATQKDAAWQAVLRLAPGLFDDAALIEGLRYELRRAPHNTKLTQELVTAYERVGTPQPAIDFLAHQPPTPANLELLADLATRSGQMDLALTTWAQLLRDPAQLTPERALRAATLAVVRGKPSLAMEWLENARATLKPDNPEATDFWRMTGLLAERQQRDAVALDAYRQLLARPDAAIADYDAAIRLLQTDHPLQAAEVAVQAWDRFDKARHLILAMTTYVGRSQWRDVKRLLDKLDPAKEASHHASAPLWREPQFLRLAGMYYQNTGNIPRAGQMLEAGLRLAPDSAEMRQAIVWLLIDSNDNVSLRKLLATHEPDWSQDKEMHDALGSAYQALSLPAVALARYFKPQLAEHQGDFLWLMNYADALDQNQETDKSWRMRRHLLSAEWAQAHQGQSMTRAQARERWLTEEGLEATRRLARARLLVQQKPGDPAFDTLRELLRLDRDAQGNLSNAAAETAIGWLQDAGQYAAERGLLWQQYARSQSLRANRPLWADITVALAEQDKAATGALLETFGERLPRYDRINAAVAIQDLRQAQTVAFETQQDQPDDNPLHLQLTENLLAFSDHAGPQLELRKLGDLDETEATAQWHMALSPRLSMDLSLTRIERTVGLSSQLSHPSQERGVKVDLRWQDHDSTTTLHLARHESLASYTPVQIEQEWRIDNRLSLRMDLGLQLPTQESTVMRMAGMKDRAGISLRYQASRIDQFTMEHWRERYKLQTGGALGSGSHSALTYMHSYRVEAPSLELGAFWSQHSYDRRDPGELAGQDLAFLQYLPPEVRRVSNTYFLPENFSYYGLQVSTNTRFERDYTRALQPYGSIARTWHSRQGPGYNLRLGLSGSVWGADHLNLGWSLGKGGTLTRGLTREIQLRYRKHF